MFMMRSCEYHSYSDTVTSISVFHIMILMYRVLGGVFLCR